MPEWIRPGAFHLALRKLWVAGSHCRATGHDRFGMSEVACWSGCFNHRRQRFKSSNPSWPRRAAARTGHPEHPHHHHRTPWTSAPPPQRGKRINDGGLSCHRIFLALAQAPGWGCEGGFLQDGVAPEVPQALVHVERGTGADGGVPLSGARFTNELPPGRAYRATVLPHK
jgi:hypothetical protein